LEIENLVAGYGGKEVLNGVTLAVADREIVTVIGHNGAGKSTLLKAIFNMVPSRGGAIRFDGHSIFDLPPHDILAAGLAYVPQNHSIFPKLTILENLQMGGFIFSDKALVRRRMVEVMERFPILGERAKQLAGDLSGGEQRMLEIARTLILDPRLVVLDEPSIGLAPRMVEQVFEIVASLRSAGKSILMVEQNVKRALQASDRGYVIDLGVARLEDRAENLIGDPRVARLYMGG
jgi:branched-chain amino acid transport system ATP-binding protein